MFNVCYKQILQFSTDTEFYGQACVERGCARRHGQSEVWPRPGSDTARRASLAWRPGVLQVQACSDSSSVSLWTAALHRTCRTTVSRPPVLTLGDSCVPATVNFLQYHVTGSILTAAGPFQWPAPQSGTLSRILSGTRPSVQTVSDVCLRRTCLLDTSALAR